MASSVNSKLFYGALKMASATPSTDDGLPTSLIIAVWCMLLLVRISMGYQPHSGEENYHGKINAYGGDYEAQRHWMELTLHLPIGDWYWYDLEYWGLDYPPLTAYVSYICGVLSAILVGPESMALFESRGYEDVVHKAYMRATVLVLDILVYGSAIWVISARGKKLDVSSLWTVTIAMSQPALILIDHGHFQYNSVSLGFALWAFHFMTTSSAQGRDSFWYCVIGAVWFCLALNFKQMTLYYAPAVFCYLLGRCCGRSWQQFAARFVALGVTVVAVFALQWWPFVLYQPTDIEATETERLVHVLRRIFPFQRGLFEGKVSNLWCALSVKPISIRQRIPETLQPSLSLALTLALILPACYKMFQVGRSRAPRESRKERTLVIAEYDLRMLLWGTTSTGLAFFLASFQVHEKSILMALAPASLLIWDDFAFVDWFSLASAWTLWPLIRVDRLEVAYACILTMYIFLVMLFREYLASGLKQKSFFQQFFVTRFIPQLSFLVMLALHVLEVFVNVPSQLPDLFPVLWSIAGCGIFCVAWLVSCWHLCDFDTSRADVQSTKQKMKKLK